MTAQPGDVTGRLLSLVLGALCVVLCGCQSAVQPRNGVAGPVHPTTPSATSTAVSGLRRVHSPGAVADDMQLHRRQCHATGALPDRACTPGGVDPTLTAAVICSPSFRTSSIRPPEANSELWKRRLMSDYGVSGSLSLYENDHLVPLELAGSNSTSNLWPEPNYHAKDLVENRLHKEVCSGKLTLAAAQLAIATNWTTAP